MSSPAPSSAAPARPRSRLWLRVRRNPVGVGAFLTVCLLTLLVVLGPAFYRVAPDATDPLNILAASSPAHPLGTDELGRDMLSRLLYGGRISLAVGLLSMLVGLTIGTLAGGVAGYFKGWAETVVMRLVDVFMSIPSFFLVLVIVTAFGNHPLTVVVTVGIGFWAQMARVVYAEFSKYRGREFVEAMHALGASHARIMFRHIFPQVLPQAVVLATLGVGWAILTEAALSYLGLGIQPPLASWGNMLQNAQAYLYSNPMLAVYPGLFIAVTVLSFNVLGNALRDVLDPRN
ncbi:Glutathione transport system permease protein GsiD [Calidithermus terrae]|uniref:Glutathione transport system permease protein GsiD n=1 Tax=Calidithermus terrae TaxID=1408545 RepID=A0A399EMR4_9DEIN|nr:ABC transporter permease [Calidithermus terrae]RIH83762.1 Glutathione transport system permease protein GsiD [Calidithermus terrae]